MDRYKSEELDLPLLPWEEPKKEAEDQPYVPKRREREWTKKRQSEIAQLKLICEVSDDLSRMYALILIYYHVLRIKMLMIFALC